MVCKALPIKARDIKARNIKARNIKAREIKARNIKAREIKARNIKARNIKARDIKAAGTGGEDEMLEIGDMNHHQRLSQVSTSPSGRRHEVGPSGETVRRVEPREA
ncbi:hypothetical protein SLS64_007744 [Diaporthe eres]|uniref:Uncharacterized protein n=1 Tax=Diaporthe eres TaxID=83184 RepID=A0ABR1NP86_DIAER